MAAVASAHNVTERDIIKDFPEASTNPDLLTRCQRICQEYRMTAADLQIEWDLLTMNKGAKRMSLEALADLESQARDTHLAKRQKHEKMARQQFSSRMQSSTFNKDTAHLLEGMGGSTTPAARRPSLSPHTAHGPSQGSQGSPGSAFASRPDAGKVVCTLNGPAGVESSSDQLEVQSLGGASERVVRTSLMWEKLEERARLLDSQVCALERALAARDELPPVVPVIATGADEVTVVGRVCCEGEGKLNVQSIFLEGSRESSNACRVRLDLSGCPEYALFPGQLVGVIGINSVGHTFVARKILPALPPPPAAARPTKISSPVTLMAAAGPFTTSDDLTYAPLTALITKVLDERPDTLIMLGPFVDEQHPALAAGDLPCTYEELFTRQVVVPLAELVERQMEDDRKVTQVVLIPSTRDMHLWSTYPQPPLSLPTRVIPEHVRPYVHAFGNPTTFCVGGTSGVSVASCSTDTLMLLGQQELAHVPPPAPGAPKPDRMARLASHILQQRQLMPLFPTPHDERNPLAVDTVANVKVGSLTTLPDVLLVPSDLAPFAKLGYGNVLCINPGRLTRKAAGGNYAMVCIHPLSDALEEETNAAKAPSDESPSLQAAIEGAADASTTPSQAAESSAADATSTAKAQADAPAPLPSATVSVPWMQPTDAPRGLQKRAFAEVKRI